MLPRQVYRTATKQHRVPGFAGKRLQSKRVSPKELASQSHLPKIENPETPDRDINPKRKLPKPAYESENFKVPEWKRAFGELFINVFRIDMDNVRAGTMGGSKYYYMCKDQGLQFKDEPLSETAIFWYQTLGLPRTFGQWFQITGLHVWLLFVRMRAMPFKVGKNYQQKLVDKFFKDIELRLSEEMNILSGQIRESYMKDFHSQLLGITFSYDEALASNSDSVLAAALWRNVFNGDRNIDCVKLEALVRYVRMQLYILNKISDRAFGFGDFEFIAPNETIEPLTPEEEEKLKEATRQKYEPQNGKILPSNRSSLSLDE